MTTAEAQSTRQLDLLELIAALLLGIAAIASAFATFQSSLYSGKSVELYSQANKLATEAAAERSRAIVQMTSDNTIDTEALLLILEADDTDVPEVVARNQLIATYLYTRQISDAAYRALGLPPEARAANDPSGDKLQGETRPDALQAAILDQALAKDLATNEAYRTEMLAASQALADQAEQAFRAGQAANGTGDTFQLVAVIYSISLFFGGIAQIFRSKRARWAIVGISGLFLLAATAYLATLPLVFS